MKIYLATDHGGYNLKEEVKKILKEKGYEIEDCGPYEYNPDDDYPDFISKAAEKVSQDPDNSKGIIFGGSGQAEMMVANKFPNVRCALFYSPAVAVEAVDISGRKSDDPYEIIRLSREHNNSNMLSLSGRFLTKDQIITAIEKWLTDPFTGEARHIRRIEKIKVIEKKLGYGD